MTWRIKEWKKIAFRNCKKLFVFCFVVFLLSAPLVFCLSPPHQSFQQYSLFSGICHIVAELPAHQQEWGICPQFLFPIPVQNSNMRNFVFKNDSQDDDVISLLRTRCQSSLGIAQNSIVLHSFLERCEINLASLLTSHCCWRLPSHVPSPCLPLVVKPCLSTLSSGSPKSQPLSSRPFEDQEHLFPLNQILKRNHTR